VVHLKGFSPTYFILCSYHLTSKLPANLLTSIPIYFLFPTYHPISILTYLPTYLFLTSYLPLYNLIYLLHTSHLPSYIITYLPTSINLSLGGTTRNVTPQSSMTHPTLGQHKPHINKNSIQIIH
jgi:hypothetical protein